MAVPRSIGDFFTWGPTITDGSYYRESRLKRAPMSNVIVHQPLDAVRLLREIDVPVIIGANSDEGTVFVYSAYPGRMIKIVFQTLVFSFFRTSAPSVMRTYNRLIKSVDDSISPDYRTVLSTIIGDYLFRCPIQLMTNILANSPYTTTTTTTTTPTPTASAAYTTTATPAATTSATTKAAVYLYEFALPTRTPGFPACNGLACHTAEIPYVFNLLDMVVLEYIYQPGVPFTTPTTTSTTTTTTPTHAAQSIVTNYSTHGQAEPLSNSYTINTNIHTESYTQRGHNSDDKYTSYDDITLMSSTTLPLPLDDPDTDLNTPNAYSTESSPIPDVIPDIISNTKALFGYPRKTQKVTKITHTTTYDEAVYIHIRVSDQISAFWTNFAKVSISILFTSICVFVCSICVYRIWLVYPLNICRTCIYRLYIIT